MDRRQVMGLLALGTVALLTGCSTESEHVDARAAGPGATPPVPNPLPTLERITPAPPLPGIPAARPGRTHLVYSGPSTDRQFALTVDDGYDAETVAGYVAFARRTRIPITFSPNGAFQHKWNPHAEVLRPLVEAGQVQIGNHTFTHKNMLHRTDRAIADDIEKNEAWIERTFRVTSRPYFRPPFGARDARTDAVAGALGYTTILMWNGDLGDAFVITPRRLIGLAQRYLREGNIVLGHANHPAVLHAFEQLEAIIAARKLRPVTLDTMFGTTRVAG